MEKARVQAFIRTSVALIVVLVVVSNAWLADDALITLRSVLNAAHGNGPNFNPGEKAQSFTHPLWFALLVAAFLILRDVIVAAFLCSVACTLGTIWLLTRRRTGLGVAAAPVLLLLLASRAFLDFSVSGLENPLSSLLLVSMLSLFRSDLSRTSQPRKRGWWLVAAALLIMTRLDNSLLVTPLVVASAASPSARRTMLRPWPTLLSTAILGIWVVTTTAYYGTFLPTSALGKLSTSLPRGDLIRQGISYLSDSLARDPATIGVILLASLAAFALKQKLYLIVLSGVFLHLAYVVWIGGDFMSGRFLTSAFVASVWVLVDFLRHTPLAFRTVTKTWAFSALAVGIVAILLPMLSPSRRALDSAALEFARREAPLPASGIADEKAFYFGTSSLLGRDRSWFDVAEWERVSPSFPRDVEIACGGLGRKGLSFGPETFLIDECGLADPFLSRKSALVGDDWRIGHLRRAHQAEYYEYKITGQFDGTGTDSFIRETREIERFTLGSPFNFDRFVRGLLDSVKPLKLSPAFETLQMSALGNFELEGASWDSFPDGVVEHSALKVTIDPRDDRFPTSVRLLLDSNDTYCIEVFFAFQHLWIPQHLKLLV